MRTLIACVLVLLGSAGVDAFAAADTEQNPCKGGVLEHERPRIWQALLPIRCNTSGVLAQSGADVSVGMKEYGELTAALPPVTTSFPEAGMCPVNVHWHLGAEHRNEGTYDLNGYEWLATHGDPEVVKVAAHYSRSDEAIHHLEIEPGNFCRGFDPEDPKFTTPYQWKYCEHMHVGYTYEVHWPHSNLGNCGTEWQYQEHFMDGVLCKANMAGYTPEEAVASIFDAKTTKMGVQAQVFIVVNDPAYDYPDWDPLSGWNTDLVEDAAVYQGSTTGQKDGNTLCKATGGMVTWQVDRGCPMISAKKFDEMCKAMLEQSDPTMYKDTHPHNARVTTSASITSDSILELLESVFES